MRKRTTKMKSRKQRIRLLIIVTIIIFMSIIGYKTFSVKHSSITVQSSKQESYLSALNESPSYEKIDNLQPTEISTDGDYIYLSDMEYTNQSKTGWRNIQKDKNPDENTIKLRKDGEVVSYSKGMGLHADGQLIYDISQYSGDFTRFISDIGVDASKSAVASITIQIYVSDNGTDWQELNFERPDGLIFKSANDCVSVDLDITGKKYLKISVGKANDGNSSDHCVLGNARIAKKTYESNSELYSKIEKVEEYDKKIANSQISSLNINQDSENYQDVENSYNANLELIKKREFVRKFGYWSIQNSASVGGATLNAVNWILEDKELLDLVIEVGEISDTNTFLDVLGTLHIKCAECLNEKDKDVYKKMMVALAAVYSTDYMSMATGFGIVKPNYDYVERFNLMKNLLNGCTVDEKVYNFEYPEQFKKLHVDLIRNVMNVGLRNDEILWMNYHTTTKNTASKFNCHGYMSYRVPIYKDEYYNEAYKSTYDEKYNLLKFGVPFADGKINREWMIIESGGVCWNISRVGQAVYKVNGIPSCGLYQPAHEAFMYYTEDNNGKGLWKMQYNVGGWGKAGTTWGGGGRYRLPLNWANKYFSDQNIGGSKGGTSSGYAILAQANLNDYSNFKKSIYYNLLANSYDNFEVKEKIYKKALQEEKLNLDSYDSLITLYKENFTKENVEEGNKWCDLANQIIENYTYYPNAMHDLIEIIFPYIEKIADKEEEISSRYYFVKTAYSKALSNAYDSRLKASEQNQYGEISQIAGVYTNEPEEIATFSFNGDKDGNHVNEIVLNDQYKINYTYSVDGGETWRKFGNNNEEEYTTDKTVELTEEELEKINEEDDIKIKMTGTSNIYTIDIEKPWCDEYPDMFQGQYFTFLNYYANDLENELFEANESTEWCYLDENNEPEEKNEKGETIWYSYTKNKPDLTNDTKIRIRIARGGTTLESETYEDYKFTKDEINNKRKYIPISEVKFKSGVDGVEVTNKDAAINGNYFISATESNMKNISGDNYLIYEFNYPVVLSAVEYIPDCSKYGQIKDGEVWGSEDGENWTLLSELKNLEYNQKNLYNFFNSGCDSDFGLVNKKCFEVEEKDRIKVRFVKIVAKSTFENKNKENIFSARMFNFFEDTEKVIEEKDTEPTADIRYSKTDSTRNSVEAVIFGKSSKDVEVVGEDKFVFETNGTHTFNLRNKKTGETGNVVASVTWIDNEVEKPDVKFSTETTTSGEVEAILEPKEDIIVLGDKFTLDGTILYYNEMDKDGKVTSRVCKDFEEGFSKYRDRDIYIDENKNIVLTKDGEEPQIVYNTIKDEETNTTEKNVLYKHKFITNETYEFTYCDLLGNVGKEEVTVDWIDNTPPSGIITYSTTSSTEGSVTATISFIDDEGNEEEGITITGVNITSEDVSEDAISYTKGSNEVIFNENCKVNFEYKDEAGNVGETEAEVTWIEKVLDSEDEKIEIQGKKVKKVSPNMALKDLYKKLKSHFSISILDNEGNKIEDPQNNESLVKTGMKVDVNGDSYTIIVTSDVNGDGEFSELDVEKMCNHYLGKEQLVNEYLEAGDIDNSNTITLKDIANIYKKFHNKLKTINTNMKLKTLAKVDKQDNEITVYISTQNLEEEINAISGEFSYNKNHMTLINVESVSSNWKVERNENKFIALKKENTKSNEEVMRLTFELKEDTKGEVALNLENLKVSDGEFEKDLNSNKMKVEIIGIIQKIPVDSVEIGSTSEKFKDKLATLEVGDTISLHTTIKPDNATETKVKWSLEKGSEAYIDLSEDGKVTAKQITNENEVKVKAIIDNKEDEIVIKVAPTEVTGISEELTDDNIYLVEPNSEGTNENTSMTIVVNVLPDNATNKEVKWESSDESVATVDNGVITAVANSDNEEETRTCKITVTSVSNPKVYKEYTVHVNKHLVKVQDIDVEFPEENKDKTVRLGDTLQLNAKITPENANFKTIEWSVIEGKDVIEISNSGHIHTLKEGKAKVRLTVLCQSSSCPTHHKDVEITVLPKPIIEVNKIEIQGEEKLKLRKNDETTLHVLVSPDDATDKTVKWESSNSEIVSVTENGVLFAKGVGTVTITAKSGKVSDEVTVTVEDVLKTDLTVYTKNQDNKFISGLILKLDKVLDNIEIRINEQESNGKISFKDLDDGKYVIRGYRNSKTRSISNDLEKAIIEYKFEVKNGKTIFEEDNTESEVRSLVFIVPENNEAKATVENGAKYQDIEKEYQEFVKSLDVNSSEPSGEQSSNEEKNPGGNTDLGEESKPDDNKENENTTNSDGNKQNENTANSDGNKQNGNTANSDGNNQNENTTNSDDNKGNGNTANSDGNKQNENTANSDGNNKSGNTTNSDSNKESRDTTSSNGNKQNRDITNQDNDEESGITASTDGNKGNESVTPNDNKENPIMPNDSKENESPTISSSSKFSDLTQNNNKQSNSKTESNKQESASLVLPKTSDIEIKTFVIMMVISFIGIVFIIYKKYKK